MKWVGEQDTRYGVFWEGFLGLTLLSMISWDATLSNEMVLVWISFYLPMKALDCRDAMINLVLTYTLSHFRSDCSRPCFGPFPVHKRRYHSLYHYLSVPHPH